MPTLRTQTVRKERHGIRTMAEKARSKGGKSTRRSRLTYFYLNGQLHKKLFINRGKDLLTAWNYPEGKKVLYTYSDVLKRHQHAWTTREVCQLIGRSRQTIDGAMREGMIERPQNTYGLDENRNFRQYMWSEEDIMALHAYLSTVHRGRPRKDGQVRPQHLPTPRELRAMLHDEEVLYVKHGDTFIPTWRAKDI